MIRSAITISLVEQARGGPFVLWDDLPTACAKAAKLGFDAVEIFAPSTDAVDPKTLGPLLKGHGLKLAALGTGAGWVIHKLHLTSSDEYTRLKALEFIKSIIDCAGELGAPAIVGSMQGKAAPALPDGLPHDMAIRYLSDSLATLGAHAARHQQVVLYEPLNRYETNLVNTIEAGNALVESLGPEGWHVKLLADLFHMNIEEQDVAGAIRRAGSRIGHVHLADSNRRAAGQGHTDFAPIVAALREEKFNGYASAEVLAWPNPDEAAALAMAGFRKFVG
jgi:sugar phosphate isomerase/epimerase